MFENFKAVSLSHKKADVEIRELISLNNDECAGILDSMHEFTSATDLLIVSTCNRTEIYYAHPEDLSDDILKLIGIRKGISKVMNYKKNFEVYNNHKDAVQHLFRVSMGLEAKVIGDMQISNQIKNAYQLSADKDLAGPLLHRLMHSIFFTNKKVVQETAFRDGAASVSYAAVELIDELTAQIHAPRVLVVGLGEMGADVARNLKNTEIENVLITNRSLDKAKELAEECDFEYVPFEELDKHAEWADVVISSVAKSEPLFTKAYVESLNIVSYKYLIDISVPRSVAPDVEEIPGAIVYNIDNIQNRSDEAVQKRLDSIPRVEELIDDSISEFSNWAKEMEVSPTIHKLKGALEQIRQEEISRYLKGMNESETEKVELITKNIMQKIIKLPVLQLKAACKRGEAETLIDVLNNIFNLEEVEVEK